MEAGYYLAKKFGAEFHLFHVIESEVEMDFNVQGGSPAGEGMDDIFFLKLIQATKNKMAELVSTPGLENIKVTSSIKIGKPSNLIFDEIENGSYDIVVMGTKGASGFSEMLIGSNAEKVVRRSPIPVFTVKEFVDESSFKSIIYASSFSENEDILINELKWLQHAFGSTLHLVRINTPNNFLTDWTSRNVMKKYIDRHHLKNYTLNVYNDTIEEDGIIYFAEEIDAGMIAMITHGRTGFAHLLSGSIAEDVVNHSKRPVLTYILNS